MKHISFLFVLCAFLLLLPASVTAQDDTFGPICDETTPGVTCPPTEVPAQEPITELPEAGAMEVTVVLLGIGSLSTLLGIHQLLDRRI